MRDRPIPYTKAQIILFLVAFYVCALLCYITVLLDASGVPRPLTNDFRMYLTIFGLAVVMPALLWFDVKVRRIRMLLFTAAHIIAVMLIFFFVGSYHPLLAMWLIICTVSYLEFGMRAFILSAVTLYVACLSFSVDAASFLPRDYGLTAYIIYSMTYCTILMTTAYIITRIIANSDKRRHALELSRRAETSQLNKVNTLLNSIGDAILTLNNEGNVTSQNAAALGFFDTNESLVGRSISGILKIQDDSAKKINVKKMVTDVTHNTYRDDITLSSETGEMRLGIHISPIYADNRRQGVVMMIRDITKQKTLEEEKDEFISVASHELRTPIAVAEGSLGNLIYMQDKGGDPAMLKAAAIMAHDQVVYLAGVVNDLSTLSRAERGVADTPEPVDMTLLLKGLYDKYSPDASKKSLKLDMDIDPKLPTIEVSRLYIEEILQNFITNAIKYTQHGTITISGQSVPGGVRCAVHDSGIGISKSDQAKIFDKFYRSEDYRTRETSGTGLGLYVVEKLAAKIGTKIEVESRLNHGSTFSLVVPTQSNVKTTGKRSNVDEK